MTVWLYQMSVKSKHKYTPDQYREEVWEDKDIEWSAKIRHSKSGAPPRKEDQMIFFFAPTGCKRPGIYGWGVIKDYDSSVKQITFRVLPPSDLLKDRPAWDDDIKSIVNKIRGFPQGNVWEIAEEDWIAIQLAMGVKLRPEEWIGIDKDTQSDKLKEALEGRTYTREATFRSRNRPLIQAKKANSDYRCEVCGFSFEERYGVIGHEYIVAHHLKLVSAGPSKTMLDDIALVCANCHDMIHAKDPPIPLRELRRLVRI